MWFKIIALVNVCAAFSLKCPEPAQWTYRAKGHCADPSKYLCLRNDFINGYSENCSRSDFQQPGEKAILRGGIYSDICSVERYQPFPIKFYTNTSTNCTFLRSFCHEEGQVLYDQGNRTTDASCRCDHRHGYDFLIKPNNQCFCKPSQEDCSCYLKICQNSIHILSSDYKCIYKTDLQKVTQCRSIKDESENNDIKFGITGNIHEEDDIYVSSMHDYIHEFCNCHRTTLVDPTNNSLVKAQSENQLLNQGQELSEKTALHKRPPPPSRPPCQQSKDKNETYAKPIVENKRQTTESRTTESSEKKALPKRPPPPSRPSCQQSEDKQLKLEALKSLYRSPDFSWVFEII
ncbi:uncharacterized protein [Mytilus edulis]|uniref:uncharacterized protein n=1 Tax=Mytilus edulis TaxID=6550 RepID=UPI0039EFE8DD